MVKYLYDLKREEEYRWVRDHGFDKYAYSEDENKKDKTHDLYKKLENLFSKLWDKEQENKKDMDKNLEDKEKDLWKIEETEMKVSEMSDQTKIDKNTQKPIKGVLKKKQYKDLKYSFLNRE